MWVERLNQMKKEEGLTLEEISLKSGISKGTLNKIFAGQTRDPQLSNISAIVHALGYTLDDLDGGADGAFEISEAEQKMIDKFRALPDSEREDVLGFIDYKHAKAVRPPENEE
jgi:Predicted transcriptional regulator with an HTH domain